MIGDCQPNSQSLGYQFLALLNTKSVYITRKYVIMFLSECMDKLHQLNISILAHGFIFRTGYFPWKLFWNYWLQHQKMVKFYSHVYFPLRIGISIWFVKLWIFFFLKIKPNWKKSKTSIFVWFFKMTPFKLFPRSPFDTFIFAQCLNTPVFIVLMSDQFASKLPLYCIC